MANKLSEDKEKVIFAQISLVRDDMIAAGTEISKREGRHISEAELLRRLTLDFVNKWRKSKGKKPRKLDPSSAPGGVPMKRGVRRRNKAKVA